MIKRQKGRITNSISSKTDYLISGENMGPAKEKSIRFGSENIN